MNTQHTPGPWKAQISKYKEHEILNQSGQMFIAQVYLFDADQQTKANARLIASAPELLDIIKNIKEFAEITELPRSVKSFLIGETTEAIKKATGQ